MALSLKESTAIGCIAELFYEFLPGSGNKNWTGHISFKTVANEVGVGDFWQPGSKTPMIVNLLSRTLDSRRDVFEKLIVEIVRRGIVYRRKKGEPVLRSEIEKLNGLLLDVSFKFPTLWDEGFLDALSGSNERAQRKMEEVLRQQQEVVDRQSDDRMLLEKLKRQLESLYSIADRQSAGISLQGILNELFSLSKLDPHSPFRIQGEEIDGSFVMDHETYLIEAKWTKSPLPQSDLLVFREKIIGKSTVTRGVMVAINGVSKPAQTAITVGKSPNFFVMNGHDLISILSGNIALLEFLRNRQRLLAERGKMFVPYAELLNYLQ